MATTHRSRPPAARRLIGWLIVAMLTAAVGIQLVTWTAPVAAQQPAEGERLAQQRACLNCHTVNGDPSVGPTWEGLAGSQEQLADGRRVVVDDAYLKRAILDPDADIVDGSLAG